MPFICALRCINNVSYLSIMLGYFMSNKRDVIKDKIIFLDFDGVMVTANQMGKDCFGPLFDLNCTKSLKEIIYNTGAGLVITSSWGNYLSSMGLRLMWQNNSYDRSERIDVWLSKHKINNYVIIDDMDYRQFEKHHHKRLVTVKSRTGLTQEESRRAIVLLNYNC